MDEKMMQNPKTVKKMFAWNLAGCIANASAPFFMLAFVSWNTGLKDTGYFSMALAVSQQLLTFGRYGIRPYQATDVKRQIRTGSYFCHRLITVSGMMSAAFLLVSLSGYPLYKRSVIWHVCALKSIDAAEDVFHGELQRSGHLDTAGKLLTLRNLLTLIVFAAFLCTSRNLTLSCRAAWMISLAVCLAVNFPAVSRVAGKGIHADRSEIGRLFKVCFPLFISQFLSLFIYNMPKYVVDAVLASEMQAVYSMIFMPAFVINMISEFVFKPLLTPLSILWETKDKKAVNRTVAGLFLAVAGITLMILAGGFLFGIPLVEWFYHVQLRAYKREFMMLLLGGGFSAAVYLSYNLLVMMRKTREVFWGYFSGMLTMAAVVWKLIQEYGVFGAAGSYLLAELLILFYFCRCIKRYIRHSTFP